MSYLFLIFVFGAVMMAMAAWRSRARRRQQLLELAQRLGLEFSPENTRLSEMLGRFTMISSRKLVCSNFFSGEAAGVGLGLAEYKDDDDPTRSLAWLDGADLTGLPECQIRARVRLFDQFFAKLLGLAQVDFGDSDPAFADAFVVSGTDAEAIQQALTPQVRRWLLAWPGAKPSVELRSGGVLLVIGQMLSPVEIEPVLPRLFELNSLLTEALAAQS